MRLSRLAVAWVLFLSMTINGTAGTDTAKKLVGLWELVKTEGTGPLGSTVEFTKDGKTRIHAKVKDKEFDFNCTYKVEGDKLTVTITVEGKTHLEINKIKKLTDMELVLEDAKGVKDEYRRIKGVKK